MLPVRLPLELGVVRVHVVCGDAFTDDAHERAAAALLDEGERARGARFVRPANRREHVLAWALVRSALGAATGRDPRSLTFVRDARGRPHLAVPDAPVFSLTHTDGLVACAVAGAGARVGLDAEREDRAATILEVAEQAFSADERAWLAAAPAAALRDARALALWTTKEAYLKALGLGIVGDLPGTTLAPGDDGDGRVTAPAPEDATCTPFALRWWRAHEHVLAVASPAASPGRLDVREGPAVF